MKKLMNQRWFLVIVFMVLYKPTILSQMPVYSTIDTLSNIFKVFVIAILFAWFFLFYQKVSYFMIALFFFEIWRIICTIYNGGNFSSLFLTLANAIALAVVVEMGLKTDPDALLDSITLVLGTYVLAHLATILIFPEGMYEFNTYTENYLFGYRNNTIMLALPAIVFSMVRSLRLYNKITISAFVILAASITAVIRAFSATAVVGICLLSVFIILAIIKFMPKFLNIYTYIIVNVLYFFGVIIMRVQNAFAFLIVDVLGRDLTFTGRTFIWDKALDAFTKSPVFGVGEISNDASRDLIGATHAHNYYLDLLYKNGIIGFLLFMIILIICGISLYKHRNNGKIPFIVSGTLFTIMFMLQAEAYYTIYYCFSILSLAVFIEYALPPKDENGEFIYKKRLKRKKEHRETLVNSNKGNRYYG